MGEIGRHCHDSALILELVDCKDVFEFVDVGRKHLLWVKCFGLALILDLEGNFVILVDASSRAESLFLAKEGIVRSQTHETGGESDSVSKVGLHFDVARLADLSLGRTIANDDRGLSEVGLIGYDFDATSFGDGDFTGI